MKSKRLVIVSAAVGAVLLAGTAGAAAAGGFGGTPEASAGNATIPRAQTAGPEAPSPAAVDAEALEQAEQRYDTAVEEATRAFAGAAEPAEKEEEEEEEEERAESDADSSSGGSSAGSEGSGGGQSGACEASNYWQGQMTANGERFDPSAMTAAHKTLPFDTMVEVTNPANGRSVTVRINDRGPYIDGRCLDLAKAAFEKIASPSAGVAQVEWRVVG
ncbi:rare lipoprotein A [Spinactinospora alkalitolerans]|uniref:Probable endolytic peptidoglycan transglycosylase RlpA n=1 Tax=Spinactinospora alkalitolerans TaxID=687207 RepID=A0A852TWY7_9ACTN|nr:septal ring lytic transglycosylase RlpA family protein [Spinactinospora alkalitolerans]NYE47402.1 rare lipoprotein A [Spinactinospora alkalitolerans]